MLLKETAHPKQLSVYYKQVTDWSRVTQEHVHPFGIGAILSMGALTLQPVVKTTQRARLPPASGKCKVCKKAGGELLACSFCTAVFHHTEECLGTARLAQKALLKSPSFPWACPACFKKGIASVQRTVLKPVGQRPAGAKKKKRKRSQKS